MELHQEYRDFEEQLRDARMPDREVARTISHLQRHGYVAMESEDDTCIVLDESRYWGRKCSTARLEVSRVGEEESGPVNGPNAPNWIDMRVCEIEDTRAAGPRDKQEILAAEEAFYDRVWYDRKLVYLEKLEEDRRDADDGVLELMGHGMAKVESKYGVENLGPYEDFEWGMVNGKLSALRWVLGEDWDMLDT